MSFESYSQGLSDEIRLARTHHDRNLIRRIRRLWTKNAFGRGPKHGEKWASILKKVDTEGSTWVVWWQDGVNQYAKRQHKWR